MKVRLAGQESESEDEESVCTWNVGCEAAMREGEDGLWAIDSEAGRSSHSMLHACNRLLQVCLSRFSAV